jgi:hypothetical protein
MGRCVGRAGSVEVRTTQEEVALRAIHLTAIVFEPRAAVRTVVTRAFWSLLALGRWGRIRGPNGFVCHLIGSIPQSTPDWERKSAGWDLLFRGSFALQRAVRQFKIALDHRLYL